MKIKLSSNKMDACHPSEAVLKILIRWGFLGEEIRQRKKERSRNTWEGMVRKSAAMEYKECKGKWSLSPKRPMNDAE